MTTEKILGMWMMPSGVEIIEVEYDSDMYAFKLCVDGKHVVSIYADSPEQTEGIRAGLNACEDVRDWSDGSGRSIGTLIAERTGDGLRETLKRLQRDSVYYNSRLGNGADGTIWVDEANGIYYEYETDNVDLRVDDLTDDDLKDIVIGGL